MRILVPIDFFPPYLGGVEIAALDISKHLVDLGHEVTVLTTKLPGYKPSELRDGIQILRFPSLFNIYRMQINPCLFMNLFMKSRKFDIVHTHFPPAFAPFVSVISAKLRKSFPPIVLTYYNDPIDRTALLDLYIHFLLRNVDAIVAISEGYMQRSDFLRYYKSKMSVITLGIDPNRFQLPSSYISPPGIKRPYILFISKLDKFHAYKGLDILLRAFKTVILQFPEVSLLVAGNGELKPSYENLTRVLGLQRHVHFMDFSLYKNMEYYFASELVAAPTKDGRQEGFGMVAVEALACGKPVITTKYVAASKDIAANELGIVVPPKDEQRLASAIIQLLSNTKSRNRMGQKGRAIVETKYSYAKIAKQYEIVFESLISD
ncbi:MAG: glycosyltransferase family 4 protein [Candidatus Heimdallarchaeota archaeon]